MRSPSHAPTHAARVRPWLLLLLAATFAASLPVAAAVAAAATVSTSCIPCRYIARKLNETEAQRNKTEQQIRKLEERRKVAETAEREAKDRAHDLDVEMSKITFDMEHIRERTNLDADEKEKLAKLRERRSAAGAAEQRYYEETLSIDASLKTLAEHRATLLASETVLKDQLAACEKKYCPPTGPRSPFYVPPRSGAEPGGRGSGIGEVRNASTDCPPCQPIVVQINTSITVLEGTYEQLAEVEAQLDGASAVVQEANERRVRLDHEVDTLEDLPKKNPGRAKLDKVKARRDQAVEDWHTATKRFQALQDQAQALRNQAQKLIDSILANQTALAKCEQRCQATSTGEKKTSMLVPGAGTTPAGPRILDASPQVIAGQSFCVCGSFPDSASQNGVSLCGVALGSPTGVSPGMLTFTAPENTPPGEGEVTGDAAAGFGAADRAAVEVLRVGGSVDRNKLLRGEATPVKLWVEGTDQPVSLRLTNTTPGIVSLEGGETQIVVTSGGAKNQVSRTLHAISPGDFHLDYSLAKGKCPCAEGSPPPAANSEDGSDAGSDAGPASSPESGE